jgi:hypothetical protein
MFKLSENQKAFCLFSVFMIFMGCAGSGDYEYRKAQEQKQIKHDAAKNAAMCK